MSETTMDLILPGSVKTLDGLFLERIRRSPDATAYRQYDSKNDQWFDTKWSIMAAEVGRWQAAILDEGVKPGDKVALMVCNSREWVVFEQAALGLGLITVPLYINDRSENISYIINDANISLLLIGGKEQWDIIEPVKDKLSPLKKIICIHDADIENGDSRLINLTNWLFGKAGIIKKREGNPDDLASIVYTSGTTGRPKGVMLSHYNILWNAWSGVQHIAVYPNELFLSILPLSHMLERTVGYYIPMMTGSTVAFSRSIALLGEDLQIIKPTVFISVPRIFERALTKIQEKLLHEPGLKQKLVRATTHIGWKYFEYQQGRDSWSPLFLLRPLLNKIVAKKIMERLGGNLRIVIVGGAALPEHVGQFFIGMGLKLQQGYGLTETSPVISVNKIEDNDPKSVGTPLTNVEVKRSPAGELMVKSPGIMKGYWNNEPATKAMIDSDGWLHTGDIVQIQNDHIYITGRLKDIIVMSNGEKVPPADMESAISRDPLFEQVLIFGEGMARLGAIVVLNESEHERIKSHSEEYGEKMSNDVSQNVIMRSINNQLINFPGYARVEHVIVADKPWTIEDGLMTPTLKLKRNQIMEKYQSEIAQCNN